MGIFSQQLWMGENIAFSFKLLLNMMLSHKEPNAQKEAKIDNSFGARWYWAQLAFTHTEEGNTKGRGTGDVEVEGGEEGGGVKGWGQALVNGQWIDRSAPSLLFMWNRGFNVFRLHSALVRSCQHGALVSLCTSSGYISFLFLSTNYLCEVVFCWLPITMSRKDGMMQKR